MPRPLAISPKFKKVLASKPVALQAAIAKCVTRLADDVTHPGLHVHKMRGLREPVWEAYVDAGNRITFHYEGDTIVLRMNCHHDILRRP